ncbi:hypothetical protein LTR37_011653 [Vermiconidia calcicola]|uniref:Uncharacterized protein n=1 Tax=Vermiconidia calcicola TaxID=1690605 RepID=A0ACC3N1E9_9PEZI|nr:hypothetical protein LTR37_011653 [Vermiconidia calcicola]
MSTPTTNFPLFPKLPAELREEIWRYCLPHRYRELDQPVADIVFWTPENRDGPFPCNLWHTTAINSRPPVISRICHESRCVAFKTGRTLPLDPSGAWPVEAQWQHDLMNNKAWQDRARDAVHLNWVSTCDIEYVSSGNPLGCLSWDASHNSVGGSMMIRCLDRYFDQHDLDDEDHSPPPGTPVEWPLSPDELRDLEALERQAKWLVVVRIVIVHSDFKAAAMTGLFGLLGDARVQVVDLSEEARVEAFFDLAKACESKTAVTIAQDFHREPADSMRERLSKSTMDRFSSQKLAEAMRPAIMFRLCTQMCNHVKQGLH